MLTVRSETVVRDIPGRPWEARIQAGRGCPEFLAGLGGPGGHRAAPKARRRERRDAPYVTHSMFWRTGAQNATENFHILNIRKKSKCCSRIGARNTLRTAMFRERGRLGPHHVADGAMDFLEVSENDMWQQQCENIENSLEICE